MNRILLHVWLILGLTVVCLSYFEMSLYEVALAFYVSSSFLFFPGRDSREGEPQNKRSIVFKVTAILLLVLMLVVVGGYFIEAIEFTGKILAIILFVLVVIVYVRRSFGK